MSYWADITMRFGLRFPGTFELQRDELMHGHLAEIPEAANDE